ncbi:ABC transporter permease [uncultured Oscillibacter sp.]|uniref:ABC transporter permease n=1 Tax=uncultured Oscillibacter sp. TaxID=876091 RepID=UPI0025D49F00|nr:ABC transporter permease subunit [uncultured Oscillibacter sp.]
MKSKQTALRPWAVAVWLLVWQGASLAFRLLFPHGELLLASPLAALARLGQLALTVPFWRSVGNSALHILGGFLLSCALAAALAALAARLRPVAELLYPLVAAVKAVPVVSFIILALVWLDSRALSLFISGLMVFPPVYLNVLAGIGAADRELLEMARVFRVPWRRKLAGIWLPAVLPYFRSAVSLSLGLCWKAGAAAEVIGLPGGTIGERLYTAKVYFQTPDLFAWTAVIVAVSLAFEKLFLRAVDRLAGKVGAL